MNEDVFATLFSHPLGQIVVTVIVAAVTAAITVRMMAPRPAPTRTVTAPPAPAPVAAGQDPALIAAISAAVYATLGAHRVVYFGEVLPGTSWTSELRTQHHTSHAVTRVRPSND